MSRVQSCVLVVRRSVEQVARREEEYQAAWRSGNVGRAREAHDRLMLARAAEQRAHRSLSLAYLESQGISGEGATDDQLSELLIASGAKEGAA